MSCAFETVIRLCVPLVVLPKSSSLLEPDVTFKMLSLDCPSINFDFGDSRLDSFFFTRWSLFVFAVSVF